jgi:hypothetical protein
MELADCLKVLTRSVFCIIPAQLKLTHYPRGSAAGTFVTCETLSCMNLSSRLLHSIPDPSPRLFLRLFVLTAIMMMGFLLIMRHSQRAQIVHHNFNMVADHSKT